MVEKNENKSEKSTSRTKPKKHRTLIHNTPLFAMYVLGTIIMLYLGILFAVAYVLYCLLSTLWFMRSICTFCPNYGHPCPSGYSRITTKLFKKRKTNAFRSQFKKNVGIVVPSWVIPVPAAGYLLLEGFDMILFILLIAFMIFGFVLLPVFSRVYGCRSCRLKDRCPWVRSKGKTDKKSNSYELT